MAIGKYKGGGLKSAIQSLSQDKDASLYDFTQTEKAIADYLYTVINRLKKSLKEKDNIARGTLEQSIDPTEISSVGGKYIVAIKYEDYGVGVDEGTKPNGWSKEAQGKMMPSIYRWMSNKQSLRSIATDNRRKYSFVYNVTRSILRKGTKGSGWLSDVIGQKGEILEAELSKVLSSVLGRDIEIIVTKQAQSMLNGSNRNS